jgi:hypothetical protein
MTTYLQAALGWLTSPLALVGLAVVLILVFSGALGRIVLFVETLFPTAQTQRPSS